MRPFSLKARIFFTVSLLILAILVGTGALSLYYFETSSRQLISEQQSTLVTQIGARDIVILGGRGYSGAGHFSDLGPYAAVARPAGAVEQARCRFFVAEFATESSAELGG